MNNAEIISIIETLDDDFGLQTLLIEECLLDRTLLEKIITIYEHRLEENKEN